MTFAKFDRHAALVDKMADTVGVDLSEAVQRGNLAPEALLSTVYNCYGCAQGDACARWLAENSNGAPETPDYCRNGDLFATLVRR